MPPNRRLLDYAVLIAERHGMFELRIRELLLIVRAPNLQDAYNELLERANEVFAWADAAGQSGEIPRAAAPPPLRGSFPGSA